MSIANQFFIIVLLISFLIFGIKFFQKANYQKIERRHISYKWLLWFTKYDIYSTTSNDYRRYMKSSNGLSTALWGSILLSVFIFLLTAYIKMKR